MGCLPVDSLGRGSGDDIRIEAAHVISSISYGQSLPPIPSHLISIYLAGSRPALHSLLLADAPRALILAISHFNPTTSPTLKAAFARALRAVGVAVAECVGPSLWGLRADGDHNRDGGKEYDVRYEAGEALDYLFQVRPSFLSSRLSVNEIIFT